MEDTDFEKVDKLKKTRNLAGKFTIVGTILVIIGFFLPWVEHQKNAEIESISMVQTYMDSFITSDILYLILIFFAVFAAYLSLRKKGFLSSVGVVFSGLLIPSGTWSIIDDPQILGRNWVGYAVPRADISTGIGVYIIFLGGILIFLLGVFILIQEIRLSDEVTPDSPDEEESLPYWKR